MVCVDSQLSSDNAPAVDDANTLGVGAVAGISIAAVLAVTASTIFVFHWYSRRKGKNSKNENNADVIEELCRSSTSESLELVPIREEAASAQAKELDSDSEDTAPSHTRSDQTAYSKLENVVVLEPLNPEQWMELSLSSKRFHSERSLSRLEVRGEDIAHEVSRDDASDGGDAFAKATLTTTRRVRELLRVFFVLMHCAARCIYGAHSMSPIGRCSDYALVRQGCTQMAARICNGIIRRYTGLVFATRMLSKEGSKDAARKTLSEPHI